MFTKQYTVFSPKYVLKDWEIHMKSISHVNTLLGKSLTKIKIQRLRNIQKSTTRVVDPRPPLEWVSFF